MMLDEYIPIVAQVGFPIAMCFLMYFDMRKALDRNTEAILQLKDKMSQ